MGSEGEIVVSVGVARDIFRCCGGLCVSVGGGRFERSDGVLFRGVARACCGVVFLVCLLLGGD